MTEVTASVITAYQTRAANECVPNYATKMMIAPMIGSVGRLETRGLTPFLSVWLNVAFNVCRATMMGTAAAAVTDVFKLAVVCAVRATVQQRIVQTVTPAQR